MARNVDPGLGRRPQAGAVPLHDEDRKKRGLLWWIVGLLALAAIILIAILLLTGGDDDKKASGGASGSAALTAGSTSLLPPPASLGSLVGENATGTDVVVQKVDGQQGFWVGSSLSQRVYVEFGAKAGVAESGAAFKPAVGQKVDLQGPVRPAPQNPGRTLHVKADDSALITKQGAYINANRVKAAS